MNFRLLCFVSLASLAFGATVEAQEDPGSVQGLIPLSQQVINYDPSRDLRFSIDDLTVVLDELNRGPSQPSDPTTTFFLDVNFDFKITPLDALIIINGLNKNPFQNFTNFADDRFDVNNDNQVTALDAMLAINELNVRLGPTNGIALFFVDEADSPNYFDVTGDEQLSSNDALQIINRLNSP